MTLIKFRVPTIHGEGGKAGFVKRVLDDGRVEVKAQDGGYYFLCGHQPKGEPHYCTRLAGHDGLHHCQDHA